MEELFIKCKNSVVNNINKKLDEEILDTISLAVLGIMLFNKELVEEILLARMKKLDFYFSNDTVLEMAHKYINNHTEDDTLKNTNAAITRNFFINNDDINNITIENEKNTLFISLIKNTNLIDLVSKIIHEFLHLIRFGGYKIKNNEVSIKDGIAISYFNINSEKLTRRYRNIEEGIVEKYTEDILKLLSEYIADKKYNIPILNKFSKLIKKYDYKSSYDVHKTIINKLCKNDKFDKLLLDTFYETDSPSNLVLYYNEVMDSSYAFTLLSKTLEDCLTTNNSLTEQRLTLDLVKNLNEFLLKSKINNLIKKL